MANLLEEYAKNLGVKIGKPIFKEHFYPILDEKYITIHVDSKIDSKHYEYFPQVLTLVKDILLSHGYKIYQIGDRDNPVLQSVDLNLCSLTKKQTAYVLRNSSLHLDVDNFYVLLANSLNINTITLYSHVYPSVTKPLWNEDKNEIIEVNRNGKKPSLSFQENPKTIRTIKPETIAQKILDKLNIDKKINFKTLKIGNYYHHHIVEVVPNFVANIEDQKNKLIYIRADLHFDDQKIAYWCHNYKSVIISSKEIPLNLIVQFSNNIDHVFFKMSDELSALPEQYFEQIKNLKVKVTISTQNKEELSQLRNKYFNIKVDLDNVEERANTLAVKTNSFFMTNKILISNSQLYPSECHMKDEKTLDSGRLETYDDVSFWKDYDHYLLYEHEN